jgi:hypothetical protein
MNFLFNSSCVPSHTFTGYLCLQSYPCTRSRCDDTDDLLS